MSWTSSYGESGFDTAVETIEKIGGTAQVHEYGIMHRDYYDYKLRCALIKIDSIEAVVTEVYHESILSEYGDGDYTPMSVLTERI